MSVIVVVTGQSARFVGLSYRVASWRSSKVGPAPAPLPLALEADVAPAAPPLPPVPVSHPTQGPSAEPSALQTCTPCAPPGHAQAACAPGTQTSPPDVDAPELPPAPPA